MNSTALSAVQHIRRMRGGSQAHLMHASDGDYYVVKFQNTPQHVRVLANEYLATKIALALGLPMSKAHVIEVPNWLVANTPELRIETAGRYFPCTSGLQLASRYAADFWQDEVFDYMPEAIFQRVVNRLHLIQVLVFDKWLGNCDGRQVIFAKSRKDRLYRMTCIDQGYCFNAAEWTFPDLPMHGVYHHNFVYSCVAGWDSFEPTLSLARTFDPQALWTIASEIPPEWYQYDQDALCCLIDSLGQRRSIIRDLITRFRNCSRQPFPNWRA